MTLYSRNIPRVRDSNPVPSCPMDEVLHNFFVFVSNEVCHNIGRNGVLGAYLHHLMLSYVGSCVTQTCIATFGLGPEVCLTCAQILIVSSRCRVSQYCAEIDKVACRSSLLKGHCVYVVVFLLAFLPLHSADRSHPLARLVFGLIH